VYSVRSSDDAVALDQLEAADRAGRIVLHLHETSKTGRLDAARLIGLVGEAQWRGAHVAVCGPAALVALVRVAARDAGAARVESEDFDIRSGVGPDRSREVEQLVTAVRRR
jgi:ferredoxin-NADP reductase